MAKILSPNLKEFELEPLRGAAPVRFGMSRDEAEQKLVERGCPLGDKEESTSAFLENTIFLTFDATGKLEYIEFRASEDLRLSYRGKNLFDTSSKEVSKAIALHEPPPSEPIDLVGSKIFPAQIITLRGAAKVNDHWGGGKRSIWLAIGIGNKAYLESVSKQVWKAPVAAANAERFVHAKFGPASLVKRSGVGHDATLELHFDDGTTRRLKASFVTPA